MRLKAGTVSEILKTNRNTKWVNGGDGFYRLRAGALEFCPEHEDGTFAVSEACTVDGNEYEAEAIEQEERMVSFLETAPEAQRDLALDRFDALMESPVRMREVLNVIWWRLDGDESWDSETISWIADAIGFETSAAEPTGK